MGREFSRLVRRPTLRLPCYEETQASRGRGHAAVLRSQTSRKTQAPVTQRLSSHLGPSLPLPWQFGDPSWGPDRQLGGKIKQSFYSSGFFWSRLGHRGHLSEAHPSLRDVGTLCNYGFILSLWAPPQKWDELHFNILLHTFQDFQRECRRNGLVFFLLFFHHTQFTSVQSLSPIWLFAIPWTAARQASLSMANPGVYSNSSIDSVMHINFMLSPRGFPPGKRASSRKRLKPLRLQGCGGGYAPSTVTHFLPTLHGVPARPPLHPNPGAVGASPPDTWAPRPRIPLLLAGGPGRTHSHPTPRASSL